jgi:hypothetical protein
MPRSKEQRLALKRTLEGLKLRGLLGCVVRAADCVVPILLEARPSEARFCPDSIDMAWSFVVGEQATPFETLAIHEAAEQLADLQTKLSDGPRNVLAAVRLTAVCAHHAYRAVEPYLVDSQECLAAQTAGYQAVLHSICAHGEVESLVAKDANALRNASNGLRQSLAGDVTSIGLPFDPGSSGPLGSTGAPDWRASVEERDKAWIEPKCWPIEGEPTERDLQDIKREQPSFLCFYVHSKVSQIDKPALQPIFASLDMIDKARLQPRPGIVVYVPDIEHSAYLGLAHRGALIVTRAGLKGERPRSAGELAKIYPEHLYRLAHPII